MAEPLKNMFSPAFKKELAARIRKEYKTFRSEDFLKQLSGKHWNEAELKARMRLIAKALGQFLPSDYVEAVRILIRVNSTYDSGFTPMVFADFVEVHGLNFWEESMQALEQFTQTSSAEFAIRAFFHHDYNKTLSQMKKWAGHTNHHVRRLASEGSRPRLPWGSALPSLKKDPSDILPILDMLKNDPSFYVRKSVANSLNDISKDHPELALELAGRWIGKTAATDWVVKHGLRGLLKKGDVRALRLFGYSSKIKVENFELRLKPTSLPIGGRIEFQFQFDLKAHKPTKLRLEYSIDYVRKGGKTTRKIFHVGEKEYKPGLHQLKRSQMFKDLTTRKHHAGKHRISIVINGNEAGDAYFVLRQPQRQ